MPISFAPNIVEGKVYRGRRRNDEADDDVSALKELQKILAAKNRKICDCEAQLHDLLENCLNCGRLTCVSEGPGKCFNCGSIVLNPDRRLVLQRHIDLNPTGEAPSTSRHLDTNTNKKTNIIDDQFDYFAIDTRKDLTDEDRRRLKESLDDLQSQRYKRKLVLDVDIEQLTAGAKSELIIDDYQKALRDLQLNDKSNQRAKACYNLHELVTKENKKTISYQYVPMGESKKNKSDTDETKASTASRVGNRTRTVKAPN